MYSLLADAALPVNPWTQLGVSAVAVAMLFSFCLALWKQHLADQTELRAQSAALATYQREQAERALPLLAKAVEVLSEAPREFDRALTRADEAQHSVAVKQLLDRLETLAKDIQR